MDWLTSLTSCFGIKPHVYGEMFDTGAKSNNGEKKASSINGAENTGKPDAKE